MFDRLSLNAGCRETVETSIYMGNRLYAQQSTNSSTQLSYALILLPSARLMVMSKSMYIDVLTIDDTATRKHS